MGGFVGGGILGFWVGSWVVSGRRVLVNGL